MVGRARDPTTAPVPVTGREMLVREVLFSLAIEVAHFNQLIHFSQHYVTLHVPMEGSAIILQSLVSVQREVDGEGIHALIVSALYKVHRKHNISGATNRLLLSRLFEWRDLYRT